MDRSIIEMKKMKKKVTLISSNGMIFDNIDLAMLSGCRHIKGRIEKAMNEQELEEGCCGDDDKIITLHVPEITGKILDMKKKKKVTLISSNGMIFDDIDLAMLSGCRLIKGKIEKAMNEEQEEGCCGDDDDDKIITLHVPEITGKILALVLDYCCISTNYGEEGLKKYEAKLATEVDDATLAHLLLAADYLDMWELAVLGGGIMHERGKGKTSLEIVDLLERKLENEEEEASRDFLADY